VSGLRPPARRRLFFAADAAAWLAVAATPSGHALQHVAALRAGTPQHVPLVRSE
jgi:hypothetical protein